MRTLIVDDEPGTRSLAAKILSRLGATSEMADNASDALRRLKQESFDIVLLDAQLPDMDGLAAARTLQSELPDVALIMMSGARAVESVIGAMQAGAVDFLVKPFGADALIRAFGRAKDRRRLRLEAGRAVALQRAIAERSVEIRLLLSGPGESASTLVSSYLSALRSRNGEAANHADRVVGTTRMICAHLDVPPSEYEVFERTAALHDVGKFALPETLLAKTDPFTHDEVEIVRRHPEFGHEVLRSIPALADCARAVLLQLEHYDGSGTPLGVRGDQIPQAARVVAVANAYDVMTHPRSHDALQTPTEALQEIAACAGTQFDPAVVEALFGAMGYVPEQHDYSQMSES